MRGLRKDQDMKIWYMCIHVDTNVHMHATPVEQEACSKLMMANVLQDA